MTTEVAPPRLSLEEATNARDQNLRADESHLYILYDRSRFRAKIGRAQDVPRRIAQLQTGSSVELEAVLFVPHAGWTEPVLHEALAPYRVRGEWFTSGGPMVRFVEAMWERRSWREGRGEVLYASDVLCCIAMSLDPTLVAYEPVREAQP